MNTLPRFLKSSAPGLFALVLALGAACALSGCVTTGAGTQSAVLRAKNKVAPALVHIRPVKQVYTQGQRQEVSIIGSGFIISPDGFVITNEHVAGESTFVRCVLSDKEEVDAEVVGVDSYTDIAVLRLKVDHPLPHVALGDSSKIEAGQTVLALGSPHGLARSVSLGIISVTNRYLEGGPSNAPFNTWIQTDAAINPGNSGGPLVDLSGNVIGVNARVLSGAENLGFAIPINIAKQAAEAIIATGRVRRSTFGLDLQEMLARTDDPTQKGVVIADVDPLSPGAKAGIRPGDILLAVNGIPLNARFEEDLPAVRKFIADLPIGEEATVKLLRNGQELELRSSTEEYRELRGEQEEFGAWGFTATELTPAIVRAAQLSDKKGILVTGTQVGGPASDAGLGTGDIVLTVDGAPIEGLADFGVLYRKLTEERKPLVLLFVKKGALTRYVLVKQNGAQGPNGESQPGAQR